MADINNPQVQENYDSDVIALKKIAGDGINEDEKDSVQDILRRLPPDIREKALNEIEEPTRKKLRDLLIDIETTQLTENAGFSEFEKKLGEKNDVLNKLFKVTDIYFSNRLKEFGFSPQKLDKIKLVLWDKLLSQLNLEGGMKMVAGKIEGKIRGLMDIFSKKGGDKKEEANIADVLEGLEKVGKELSSSEEPKEGEGKEIFVYFDSLMGDSFKKLKEEKEKGTELMTIEGISVAIYGENQKRTLEEIKNATIKKGESFTSLKKTGNTLVDLIGKLPESWQTSITDFLKNLVKDYPFLGLILGLFFPLDFLNIDEKDKAKKESILNLAKFAEKEGSPIKGLDIEALKKLETKDLKEFFEYMEAKDINYSKEGFWEAILTKKTEDAKLLGVYNLLKGNKEKFELTDDDKKDNGKGFINKLNGLSKIENDRKIKESTKKQEELELEIERLKNKGQQNLSPTRDIESNEGPALISTGTGSLVLPTDQIRGIYTENISIETPEQEATRLAKIKDLEVQQQKLAFENSIRSISSLPPAGEIVYKGEKISINVDDGKKIIIGGKKYQISIMGTIEAFEGIYFKDGNFTMKHKTGLFSSGETILQKQQLTDVLATLLDEGKYIYNIPEKDDKSKTKAKLSISEIT